LLLSDLFHFFSFSISLPRLLMAAAVPPAAAVPAVCAECEARDAARRASGIEDGDDEDVERSGFSMYSSCGGDEVYDVMIRSCNWAELEANMAAAVH